MRFHQPSLTGALRQGELLGEVLVYSVAYPPNPHPEDTIQVDWYLHQFMFVMSPECDLEWDFKTRFPSENLELVRNVEQTHRSTDETVRSNKLMSHVLLCDAYKHENIRGHIGNTELWRRVQQNQDERYHHLAAAFVGEAQEAEIPHLYLDFKTVVALPASYLYEGLSMGSINRIAQLPPIYLHNLIQRFYSFMSRVGLPD